MKKILLVAQDFPFPPNNGARLDMWGHLQSLQQIGATVDVIATVRKEPSADAIRELQSLARNITIIPRKSGWRAAASVTPFSVKSRGGLRDAPLSDPYDAVILEAEHVADLLDNSSLKASRKILRVHNNEANAHWQFVKLNNSLKQRLFHLSEAFKFWFYSERIFQKCDALWFISDYERNKYVEAHPKHRSKALFLPPYVDLNKMERLPLDTKQVLFLGALGVVQNSEAVRWYLKKVHHSLLNISDYQFVAAGNSLGKPLGDLVNLAMSQSRAAIEMDIAELAPLYRASSVFINPVFRGTGVKLKTIHAIQAGLPVISTAIGIEGTGLIPNKHVLVADAPDDFASKTRSLLLDQDIARELTSAAQAFISSEYNQAQIIANQL